MNKRMQWLMCCALRIQRVWKPHLCVFTGPAGAAGKLWPRSVRPAPAESVCTCCSAIRLSIHRSRPVLYAHFVLAEQQRPDVRFSAHRLRPHLVHTTLWNNNCSHNAWCSNVTIPEERHEPRVYGFSISLMQLASTSMMLQALSVLVTPPHGNIIQYDIWTL